MRGPFFLSLDSMLDFEGYGLQPYVEDNKISVAF